MAKDYLELRKICQIRHIICMTIGRKLQNVQTNSEIINDSAKSRYQGNFIPQDKSTERDT